MRLSFGIGIMLLGVVACAATSGDSSATEKSRPAAATKQGNPGSTTPGTSEDGAPESEEPPPPPAPILPGIAVQDVAVFQAVKVPVVTGGALVTTSERKAPVVANRPGIVRVYVKPGASWKPREVTAELRLVAGKKRYPFIRETKTISGASKEEELASTFNLEVPADSLPAGVTFQVALTAADGAVDAPVGEAKDGRFPRTGSFDDLGAERSGKVRIVVVPVEYNGDRSGRLPALGPTELALYRNAVMRLYPASDVELTVHQPLPWSSSLAGGVGFTSLLRAITQLREDDKVDDDVYYYGLAQPAKTMTTYCTPACVLGLSVIVEDPASAAQRVSVGVGFADEKSANTMAHEVGHAHGRKHAPCGGAQDTDSEFPYSGGSIGVWGYDIFAKTLIAPKTGTDIMGYCKNEWISDYTYAALFERISAVSVDEPVAMANASAPSKKTASYRVATVGASGELSWDGDIDFDDDNRLRGGAIRQASFLAESGATISTRAARFFRFDHLPGGFVFVPKETTLDDAGWKAVAVEGFTSALAR